MSFQTNCLAASIHQAHRNENMSFYEATKATQNDLVTRGTQARWDIIRHYALAIVVAGYNKDKSSILKSMHQCKDALIAAADYYNAELSSLAAAYHAATRGSWNPPVLSAMVINAKLGDKCTDEASLQRLTNEDTQRRHLEPEELVPWMMSLTKQQWVWYAQPKLLAGLYEAITRPEVANNMRRKVEYRWGCPTMSYCFASILSVARMNEVWDGNKDVIEIYYQESADRSVENLKPIAFVLGDFPTEREYPHAMLARKLFSLDRRIARTREAEANGTAIMGDVYTMDDEHSRERLNGYITGCFEVCASGVYTDIVKSVKRFNRIQEWADSDFRLPTCEFDLLSAEEQARYQNAEAYREAKLREQDQDRGEAFDRAFADGGMSNFINAANQRYMETLSRVDEQSLLDSLN